MLFIKTKNKSSLDDAALIVNYKQSGDKDFIGVLFERYAHLIFAVCMKYLKDEDESKDAVLQIFEKLMDDLKKYEVAKFSYWLHSVAKNYCLMLLRNRQALHRKEEDFRISEKSIMESDAEIHLSFEKQIPAPIDKLNEAIQSLSTEQKICVELFYLKEKCYNEVSELTGFSMNEVKSYIQNGKRNLKIYLQKHSHEFHR